MHITCRAFSKCLRENLNSQVVKYIQARVSRYKHTGYLQKTRVTLTILKIRFSESTGNSAIIFLPHVKTPKVIVGFTLVHFSGGLFISCA